jgi:hypothetical protein
MADHAEAGYELVEVKAEDIMAERRGFYEGFLTGTVWSVGGVIAVLVLMAIFLV